MKFTGTQLQDMVYEDYEENDPEALVLIESKIIGTDRWTINYKGIFSYKGKYYQTYWRTGTTEMQKEYPFEYVDKADCPEVVQVEVFVKQWRVVE